MNTFRTLMDYVNAPFDKITTPQFARELHGFTQAFTALLAGFAVTAWIVAKPHVGLILCVLGIAAVPLAWLITSLVCRMAVEIALVILSIHHEITRYTQTGPLPTPPDDHSGGKEIER